MGHRNEWRTNCDVRCGRGDGCRGRVTIAEQAGRAGDRPWSTFAGKEERARAENERRGHDHRDRAEQPPSSNEHGNHGSQDECITGVGRLRRPGRSSRTSDDRRRVAVAQPTTLGFRRGRTAVLWRRCALAMPVADRAGVAGVVSMGGWSWVVCGPRRRSSSSTGSKRSGRPAGRWRRRGWPRRGRRRRGRDRALRRRRV